MAATALASALLGLATDLKKHHGDLLTALARRVDKPSERALEKLVSWSKYGPDVVALHRWHDGSGGQPLVGDLALLSAQDVLRQHEAIQASDHDPASVSLRRVWQNVLPLFADSAGERLGLDLVTGQVVEFRREVEPVVAYASLGKLIGTMRAAARKGVLVGKDGSAYRRLKETSNPGGPHPHAPASAARDLGGHEKDPRKGLALVDQALRCAPDDYELHLVASSYASHAGTFERSMQAYDGRIRTAPTPAIRFKDSAYRLSTRVHSFRHLFEDVIREGKLLSEQVGEETAPKDVATMWGAIAFAYLRTGQNDLAKAAYREVLARETSEYGRAQLFHSIADLSRGEERDEALEGAMHSHERWLQSHETDAPVNYALARAYALRGRRAEALVKLRRAIDLHVSYAHDARREGDFASLQDDPAFDAVIEGE